MDYLTFHGTFQAGRNIPLHGSVELTHRCNLLCAHCYLPLTRLRREGDLVRAREAMLGELTTDEWKRVLGEAIDAGCLDVLLTGGDPLLRHDFLEIYRFLRTSGVVVTVFTNATLLTEAIADGLAGMPPAVVEVSMYGATAETCDRVTGIPGSHAAFLRGLRLLLARGIRTRLKSVLLAPTRNEIGAMRDLAHTFGLGFKLGIDVFPAADGAPLPPGLLTDPEDAADTVLAEPTAGDGLGTDDPGDPGTKAPGTTSTYLFRCRAGRRSFAIDPRGHMQLCLLLRTPRWDLRRMPFREAWAPVQTLRGRQRSRPSRCAGCPILRVCPQCPARNVLETDDLEDPGTRLCLRTHALGRAMGLTDLDADAFLASRGIVAERPDHAGIAP